jgi:protein TonB
MFSLILTGIRFSNAQDTTYLNASKNSVAKQTAVYYRLVSLDDTLYRSAVYTMNGKIVSIQHYAGKDLKILEGPSRFFYANGLVDSEGSFKKNLKTGSWKFYSSAGKRTGFIFFNQGKIATADYLERYGHMMDGDNDAMPSFKGGREALMEYIRKRLNPIQKEAKEKYKGTVKVAFVVSETGKVTNARVISGINEQIDQKALQLISGMPDWHPGMQYDKPVKVPLVLPIVF